MTPSETSTANRFRFRAWDRKKMIYPIQGDLLVVNDNGEVEYWFGGTTKCAIQWSTGLTDKNGVIIYDGDIVEKLICTGSSTERKVYEVVFYYDGFCLKNNETYAFGSSKDNRLIKERVIGNIYENPDLLPKAQ